MPLKPTYAGSPTYTASYGGVSAEMFFDAESVNGHVQAPDPTDPSASMQFPRLTNGQLAALVRAWQRAAARSKASSWPIGYELTIAALGWSKPGDKFVMTTAHANEPAPPELIEMFWNASDDLAKRLDADGTVFRAIPVDWSYPGYEQAARDAWTQMQREAAAAPAAAPVTPPPAPLVVTSAAPAITAPAPAAPASSGGGAWIILVLLAIAAGSKDKRKGSR